MKRKVNFTIIASALVISVFAFGSIYYINQKDLKNSLPDSTDSSESTLDNNDEKRVFNVNWQADLSVDLSNSSIITEAFDYISLVRIESIDGVSNYNSLTEKYVNPYTYGKATILRNIKGTISNNEITYRRLGGVMSFNDWLKGDPSPEKIMKVREESSLRNISTNDILVSSKVNGDIDIEVGKTYLVFLMHDDKINKENEYFIDGLQYGLREVQQSNISTYSVNNISDLKIKNNVTGEWENLSNVINLDISE